MKGSTRPAAHDESNALRGGAGPFKEAIGPEHDAFEREADRVADAVARGQSAGAPRPGWAGAAAAAGVTIQRKCAECEQEEEEKIRRAPKDSAPAEASAPAEVSEPAARSPAVAEAAPALLVDGEGEIGRGQMRKADFMAALRAETCGAVDAALAGTGRDSQGCPYIDYWFGYYDERSAAQVERSLRRFAPEAAGAAAARDYVRIVSARIGRGAQTYAKSGEIPALPDDVPMPGAGGLLGAFGGMFFKARPGGARHVDPVSVRDQLGAGQPLPGRVRDRMESAFGESFGGVRIHTDPTGAELSDGLNARAFTVGRHVAFGRGEFRPGTLAGDALIAHELAHVVQQRGPASSPASPVPSRTANALEHDADRSAASFVRQQFHNGRAVAREAVPRLRTGLTLSRCSKDKPKDLHAGTARPDATQQASIQSELHPTTAASGAPLPDWDASVAASGTPAEKTARKDDLKTKVTDAMGVALDAEMPRMHDLAAAGRVPITSLEGPGKAAKKVVDKKFKEWISVAALTPSQSTLRHGFKFKGTNPGKNLFDANDPAQRAAAGLPIDPADLASWLAETHGATAMKDHDFSPSRSVEEGDFFNVEIVAPFAGAREADLKLFDRFGFAITNPLTKKIVTPTALEPGLSSTPGSGGEPSEAERFLRWSTWETLVHEYIHTLEHPAFHSAGGRNNRIMMEGFCTFFSREVLNEEIPKAPKDSGIRADVEGGSFHEPPAGTVPAFDAGDYAQYLGHADKIRDVVGDNAMKAAFFQGHVEFLGLDPAGGTITPVAVADRDLVKVPPGTTTVSALAHAAGVKADVIVAANSGLTATSAVSGRVHVPGAREHTVVSAGAGGVETKQQIAKQNGVSEDALTRANPGVVWASLAAGDTVLIPKH